MSDGTKEATTEPEFEGPPWTEEEIRKRCEQILDAIEQNGMVLSKLTVVSLLWLAVRAHLEALAEKVDPRAEAESMIQRFHAFARSQGKAVHKARMGKDPNYQSPFRGKPPGKKPS